MNGAITNYENTFYLNGVALSGISSVDGSYSLDYVPINVLGKGYVKQVLASVPKANIGITRYLVNNDPVFNLTGNGGDNLAQSISGGLYYKTKSFSFKNAYINSFSLNCAVGEVPQLSSNYDIYGDIGPLSNPTGNGNAGSVFVPQVKDITVSGRNFNTNRITDFNISFNCPKMPIYGLVSGSGEYPIEVHNILPIEVVTSFNMEVDTYQTKKAFDDLYTNGDASYLIKISGTILKDIPLTTWDGQELTTWDNQVLYSYLKSGDGVSLFNFTGFNAKIVSEEINSSADDLLSVKLTYKSYLN